MSYSSIFTLIKNLFYFSHWNSKSLLKLFFFFHVNSISSEFELILLLGKFIEEEKKSKKFLFPFDLNFNSENKLSFVIRWILGFFLAVDIIFLFVLSGACEINSKVYWCDMNFGEINLATCDSKKFLSMKLINVSLWFEMVCVRNDLILKIRFIIRFRCVNRFEKNCAEEIPFNWDISYNSYDDAGDVPYFKVIELKFVLALNTIWK